MAVVLKFSKKDFLNPRLQIFSSNSINSLNVKVYAVFKNSTKIRVPFKFTMNFHLFTRAMDDEFFK